MKPLLKTIVTGILIVGLAAFPVATPITAQQQTQPPCPTVTFTVEGVEQPDGTWPCWDVTICADEKEDLEDKVEHIVNTYIIAEQKAIDDCRARVRNCAWGTIGGTIGGVLIAVAGGIASAGTAVAGGTAIIIAAVSGGTGCIELARSERDNLIKQLAAQANEKIRYEIDLGTNDPGERYIAHAY